MSKTLQRVSLTKYTEAVNNLAQCDVDNFNAGLPGVNDLNDEPEGRLFGAAHVWYPECMLECYWKDGFSPVAALADLENIGEEF